MSKKVIKKNGRIKCQKEKQSVVVYKKIQLKLKHIETITEGA
jgi:hypothetical protein